MARVTVEDCIEVVDNRFELVEVAAQRVRQVASGLPLTIERDNDKDTIIALRELAGGSISADALREELIVNQQKYGTVDEIDDNQALIGGGAEEGSSEAADDLAELQAGASDEIADDLEAADALAFGEDDVVDTDD